ncbi:MAG: DUF2066 domain-containing protein [Magnetococcus sp. MYC-9]
MNSTKRFLEGSGSICRRGLFLLLVLWGAMAGVVAEAAGFYQVGAEVSVPLPVAAHQDPRTIGMEKAKKVALDRLLQRMFSRADLEREKPFFDSLGRGMKSLTERVQVVSETQRANQLLLAVEVTFSAKGIAAALAQKGLSYNESRHPAVLFMVRGQGGSAEERARGEQLLQKALLEEGKGLGMPVVTPMGDVEDMGQLSWEAVVSGAAPVRQWSLARYGTNQLWAVALQLVTPGGEAAANKKGGHILRAQLLGGTTEHVTPPPPPLQAEVTSASPPDRCVEQGDTRTCPYTVLARTLLQQMADQWVQAHAAHPGQQHVVLLRILHGPKLAQFSQFVNKLRSMPGVANLKFVEERATESSMQMTFRGQDAQLQEMIRSLGVQVVGVSGPGPTAAADPTVATDPPEAGTNPSGAGADPPHPPPPTPVELQLLLP